MPDVITPGDVPTRDLATAGWTFRDIAGATRSSSTSNPGSADFAALATLVGALATLSNASPIEIRANGRRELDTTDTDWFVLDEAFATVNTVAVFVAEDFAAEEVQAIEVPAPDASILSPGSSTVINLSLPVVATVVSAIEAFLNTGGGQNYAVVRGFISSRSKRARGAIQVPESAQIGEPSPTALPSDEPGTLELPSGP